LTAWKDKHLKKLAVGFHTQLVYGLGAVELGMPPLLKRKIMKHCYTPNRSLSSNAFKKNQQNKNGMKNEFVFLVILVSVIYLFIKHT